MCFAGSIRGAIAFGLAVSIPAKSAQNREVLLSTTLVLVFFTTIVFGAMMPAAVHFLKKGEIAAQEKNKGEGSSTLSINEIEEKSMEKYHLQRYDSV